MRKSFFFGCCTVSSLLFSAVATAQPAEPAFEAPAPPPATKPKPPPYSLPFQLRTVIPGNVVRSDTAFAFYKAPNDGPSGSTIATTLLASYKVTEELAPLLRLGVVSNSPPANPPPDGTSFTNPVLGAIYGLKLSPELRLGLFLGLTLPIGTGGGNTPDAGTAAANRAGIPARSAMDNAMFAVNDFTVFPGVGLAFLKYGLTVQVEATLLQLTRVRGEDVQVDKSRTNFTTGLHVGYFIAPIFSLGTEIRHQRWLSTPAAVEANDSLRDTTTWAIGPRFHLKLGEKMWLRPGLAYAMPLDKPMTDGKYKIVQLDVPFVF